jgi:lysophospholipase L1-like esterase
MKALISITVATCFGVSLGAGAASAQADVSGGARSHWVGAWEGAPESGGSAVRNQSFRLLVHTSIGGSVLRLRFSNAYGITPLTLSDATVGLPTGGVPGPAVEPATLRAVRFVSGSRLTILAGQDAYSLPVPMQVPPNAWLSVSFYVPGSYTDSTFHQIGMTTSYATGSGGGDQASDPSGSQFASPTISWTYLTGVDVKAPPRVSTIVALGDSITDCCIEIPDSNMRWPDLLDERLAAVAGGQRFTVVNAGISGNDVSNDRGGNATQGTAGDIRDVRDVFDEPNVSTVILFEGINDIGTGVDAAHIIAAYERVASDAHARGLRVVICTMTPSFGSVVYGTDYTTKRPSATRSTAGSWRTPAGSTA